LAKSLREYVKTGAGIFSRLFFIEKAKKSGQRLLSTPKRGNTRKPYNQRFDSFPFFYTKEK
jgi:hypothetical protein